MLRNGMWVLGLGVALLGCGGPSGGAREAGEVAAQYQGPIQSTDTARGEEVYNTVCMSCHGAGAPNLEGIGWEAGAMRQQIREGHGRMPAISQSRLSDEDMEALLAYMTTIGAVNGGAEPAEGASEPASEGASEPAIPDDEEADEEQDEY